MPSAFQNLALFPRKTFQGRSDKYSPLWVKANGLLSVRDALGGLGPYDVTRGTLIGTSYRDSAMERLERYRQAWKFYDGEHFTNPYDDGEKKVVFNFCRTIVDRGVEWFQAKGWSVVSPTGNELIANLLNQVWEANNRSWLTTRQAQFGAVTGDSFFYVGVRTKDDSGKDLPQDKRQVYIQSINPAYCFPFFNDDGSYEPKAALIQYPTSDSKTGELVLFSLLIEPEKWTTWVGEVKLDEGPNLFGKVNLVHVPNFYRSDSCFGMSDIEQVIPVNEEYNSVANAIRRIVKYHAEPTTLIFGARASDLEKGAKKVWSNLPVEAKVENLKLDSDLEANYRYLEILEAKICALSDTPKHVLDASQAHVSNTSGLAMQLMFQPLIAKNRRRQVCHSRAVKACNDLILTAHEWMGDSLTDLADHPETLRETEADYTSTLPKDEQTELDMMVKKVEAGFLSKAEALRRVSGVKDTEQLALELLADERHKLAFKLEEARAMKGVSPNLTVGFLGSVALGEDLSDMAASVQKVEDKAVEQSGLADPK